MKLKQNILAEIKKKVMESQAFCDGFKCKSAKSGATECMRRDYQCDKIEDCQADDPNFDEPDSCVYGRHEAMNTYNDSFDHISFDNNHRVQNCHYY